MDDPRASTLVRVLGLLGAVAAGTVGMAVLGGLLATVGVDLGVVDCYELGCIGALLAGLVIGGIGGLVVGLVVGIRVLRRETWRELVVVSAIAAGAVVVAALVRLLR